MKSALLDLLAAGWHVAPLPEMTQPDANTRTYSASVGPDGPSRYDRANLAVRAPDILAVQVRLGQFEQTFDDSAAYRALAALGDSFEVRLGRQVTRAYRIDGLTEVCRDCELFGGPFRGASLTRAGFLAFGRVFDGGVVQIVAPNGCDVAPLPAALRDELVRCGLVIYRGGTYE